MKNGVWLGAELNRRHVDFQSTALPTELPSRGERETRAVSKPRHYAKLPRGSKRRLRIAPATEKQTGGFTIEVRLKESKSDESDNVQIAVMRLSQ